MSSIERLFNNLNFKNRRKIIRIVNQIRTTFRTHDLNYLAEVYKTDKWSKHFYTPHYCFHLQKFKRKSFNLLEIGVGGYENPHQGAGSLRMWERFFSNARIVGLDIFDKSELQEGRIKIVQGSQTDQTLLEKLVKEVGGFDIIIDDGSHQNHHIIETFTILFPLLNNGGIYVIEDVQTSYWQDYGGSTQNPDSTSTAMGFFKGLIHGLNYSEFEIPDYRPGYYERKIISIHFYHNLIFIYKGENDEKSNITR